ncbi:hypothetical protein AAE478_006866 [Parahypoxylon ruwenzoriense]
MPPRIPLLAALRRPSTLITAQKANISTTKSSQELLRNVPTAASSLLGIDSFSSRGAGGPDSTDSVSNIYEKLHAVVARRASVDQELRQRDQSDDYARQMTRRWKAGEVYAPHDLSPSEMGKWRRNQARKRDLVDLLGINPLDMYRNFSVISEFVTSHGRIKRSVETGLRPANQRKLAKAIRRAIGLGLHPSVHKHPELLVRENSRFQVQNMATVKKDLKWT